METLTLKAKKREISGKKVKKLRNEGFLPAVIYGREIKSESIEVDQKEFKKIFKNVGENTLITLDIDNKDSKKVLISDPQVDPVTDEVIHIDFHQVKLTEKINAKVPLEFVNEEEAQAVKELEGTLVKERDEIEVECLPSDIPHDVKVDVSRLDTFDDKIHISDLNIPSNVKVLDDSKDVVVLVMPPRSEEELKELEEEVVEDIEKVEDVEKKEDEEGEEGGEEGEEEKTSQEVSPEEQKEKK